MAKQKRGSSSLPAHKSHLLHYMFTLATNQRAQKQHRAAIDPKKTVQQRRQAQAAIRSRYGITSRDWKALTGPYPSEKAANDAITAHLKNMYPDGPAISPLVGIASIKLQP
jgi:hypothetical protein